MMGKRFSERGICPRFRRKSRGFTLLEVMVAMSVFAVMAAAMTTATQRNSQYAGRLEEKSIGHWIAMNKMAELQGKGKWPKLGSKTEDVEMARREWLVTTLVEARESDNFRLIQVDVSLKTGHIGGDGRRVSRLKSLMTNMELKE